MSDTLLIAKQLFSIQWKDHLNSKERVKYNEELLKFIPRSIVVDAGKILIPNNYLSRIDIYTLDGKMIDSFDFEGDDVDLAKFYLNNKSDTLWIWNKYQGLFVFDREGRVFYHDEQVEDMFVGVKNALIVRSDGQQLQIRDKRGFLSKSLSAKYYTMWCEEKDLYGLKIDGRTFDDPFYVEKIDMITGVQSIILEAQTLCCGCSMFPGILGSRILLQSSDAGDKISYIGNDKREEKSVGVKYPSEFKALTYFEFLDMIYNGFAYWYDAPTKTLYSIGSNEEGMTIFEITVPENIESW